MSRPTSKFAPYKAALEIVSNRTKTPLPSLVASFAILHEITAVVPLISIFFFARSLGIGEQAVMFVRKEITEERERNRWVREKGSQWIDEGERWAAKVGKRYGIFGFPKVPKGSDAGEVSHNPVSSHHLAEDVANAALAYGATKALIPVRIGVSMYLSPAFSRGFVEPIRSRIVGSWRRTQ